MSSSNHKKDSNNPMQGMSIKKALVRVYEYWTKLILFMILMVWIRHNIKKDSLISDIHVTRLIQKSITCTKIDNLQTSVHY